VRSFSTRLTSVTFAEDMINQSGILSNGTLFSKNLVR